MRLANPFNLTSAFLFWYVSRCQTQYAFPPSMSRKIPVAPEDYLHNIQELWDKQSFGSTSDIYDSEFIELSDHEKDSEIDEDFLENQ